MLNANKLIAAVALSTATLFTAPIALADNHQHEQQMQQNGNYISPEQAAEAAKKRIQGGYVTDVEFEYNGYRGAHYDVEIVDEKGREYDVTVDAKSGQVVSSRRDY